MSATADPVDLATSIAQALRREGEYLVETESVPAQRLVDVYWAAHKAGRIVGQKVSFELRTADARVSRVSVKVTCQRPGRVRANLRES